MGRLITWLKRRLEPDEDVEERYRIAVAQLKAARSRDRVEDMLEELLREFEEELEGGGSSSPHG